MLLLMNVLLVLALMLLLVMLWLWRQQGRDLRHLQERVDGLQNALRESLASQVSLYRQAALAPEKASATQDLPVGTASPAWDQLPSQTQKLAEQGFTEKEIAERLGLGIADVQLLLRLRR
jgi:DNA-binding NarL/FixJ family response regulator